MEMEISEISVPQTRAAGDSRDDEKEDSAEKPEASEEDSRPVAGPPESPMHLQGGRAGPSFTCGDSERRGALGQDAHPWVFAPRDSLHDRRRQQLRRGRHHQDLIPLNCVAAGAWTPRIGR